MQFGRGFGEDNSSGFNRTGGSPAFGFSSNTASSSSSSSAFAGAYQTSNPELSRLSKTLLTKKDSLTRLKALEELYLLFQCIATKTGDGDIINLGPQDVVPVWLSIFSRLLSSPSGSGNDSISRRVREAVFKIHGLVVDLFPLAVWRSKQFSSIFGDWFLNSLAIDKGASGSGDVVALSANESLCALAVTIRKKQSSVSASAPSAAATSGKEEKKKKKKSEKEMITCSDHDLRVLILPEIDSIMEMLIANITQTEDHLRRAGNIAENEIHDWIFRLRCTGFAGISRLLALCENKQETGSDDNDAAILEEEGKEVLQKFDRGVDKYFTESLQKQNIWKYLSVELKDNWGNPPQLRSCACEFLISTIEHKPKFVHSSLQNYGNKIFSKMLPVPNANPMAAVDISNSQVSWDALLLLIHKYPDIWEFIDINKALLPEIWKHMKFASDNNIADQSLKNLLPLFSMLPTESGNITKGFFAHAWELLLEVKDMYRADLIVSILECIAFHLSRKRDEDSVIEPFIDCINYLSKEEMLDSVRKSSSQAIARCIDRFSTQNQTAITNALSTSANEDDPMTILNTQNLAYYILSAGAKDSGKQWYEDVSTICRDVVLSQLIKLTEKETKDKAKYLSKTLEVLKYIPVVSLDSPLVQSVVSLSSQPKTNDKVDELIGKIVGEIVMKQKDADNQVEGLVIKVASHRATILIPALNICSSAQVIQQSQTISKQTMDIALDKSFPFDLRRDAILKLPSFFPGNESDIIKCVDVAIKDMSSAPGSKSNNNKNSDKIKLLIIINMAPLVLDIIIKDNIHIVEQLAFHFGDLSKVDNQQFEKFSNHFIDTIKNNETIIASCGNKLKDTIPSSVDASDNWIAAMKSFLMRLDQTSTVYQIFKDIASSILSEPSKGFLVVALAASMGIENFYNLAVSQTHKPLANFVADLFMWSFCFNIKDNSFVQFQEEHLLPLIIQKDVDWIFSFASTISQYNKFTNEKDHEYALSMAARVILQVPIISNNPSNALMILKGCLLRDGENSLSENFSIAIRSMLPIILGYFTSNDVSEEINKEVKAALESCTERVTRRILIGQKFDQQMEMVQTKQEFADTSTLSSNVQSSVSSSSGINNNKALSVGMKAIYKKSKSSANDDKGNEDDIICEVISVHRDNVTGKGESLVDELYYTVMILDSADRREIQTTGNRLIPLDEKAQQSLEKKKADTAVALSSSVSSSTTPPPTQTATGADDNLSSSSSNEPKTLIELNKLLAVARSQGNIKESRRLMELLPKLVPKPKDSDAEKAKAKEELRKRQAEAQEQLEKTKDELRKDEFASDSISMNSLKASSQDNASSLTNNNSDVIATKGNASSLSQVPQPKIASDRTNLYLSLSSLTAKWRSTIEGDVHPYEISVHEKKCLYAVILTIPSLETLAGLTTEQRLSPGSKDMLIGSVCELISSGLDLGFNVFSQSSIEYSDYVEKILLLGIYCSNQSSLQRVCNLLQQMITLESKTSNRPISTGQHFPAKILRRFLELRGNSESLSIVAPLLPQLRYRMDVLTENEMDELTDLVSPLSVDDQASVENKVDDIISHVFQLLYRDTRTILMDEESTSGADNNEESVEDIEVKDIKVGESLIPERLRVLVQECIDQVVLHEHTATAAVPSVEEEAKLYRSLLLAYILLLRQVRATVLKQSSTRTPLSAWVNKSKIIPIVLGHCFGLLGVFAGDISPFSKKLETDINIVSQTLAKVSKTVQRGRKLISDELTDQVDDVINDLHKDFGLLCIQCIFQTFRLFPVLGREWWNDLSRADNANVSKYVAKQITPWLIGDEVREIRAASEAHAWDLDVMEVKASLISKNVVTRYTRDECTLEMEIQLPDSFPLQLAKVECTKQIGVRQEKWKKWALQIINILSRQNGTILDAVVFWKQSLDREFEGIEPCPICYSVIHHGDNSLPRMECKTCHQKFHPKCLVKWFQTSHKNECPLCKQSFR